MKSPISKKLDVIALANTFAVMDIILHMLFRIWIWVSPSSYEQTIHLFVAGLNIKVSSFDISIYNILISTFLEAIAFWVLGFAVAIIYNKLSGNKQNGN